MKRLALPLAGLLLSVASVAGTQNRPAQPPPARNAEFDATWAKVKAGRTYKAEPKGDRHLDTVVNGTPLDNILSVPPEYDPAKPWPLRVQLHGGVGRLPPQQGGAASRPLTNNRIAGGPQLVLQPRAYSTTEWWERNQAANVVDLIEQVKRTYNVDESRVYITGISDGGTGVYFFAMRNATPWSACMPLNGHPSVLANEEVGADGALFISNLVNCPMYLVNGGKDPLYPAASVAPLVEVMKRAGVQLLFNVYPDAGHNTNWWPVERPKYEAFLAAHPRVAHPAKVSWATERTDRYNRFRWLVIDRLGSRDSDVSLEDVNSFPLSNGRQVRLYARPALTGRVDVSRQGNTFEAKTRGVQQFTLLLSRDVVDFSKPVKVTVNGRSAFDGVVVEDVATLTRWAERDNDRTMLYGVELKINVP
jgi:poly(3-hydroxybutyrate) depolymerase